MALHFPKPVLWVIAQEIEEPTDEDLQQVSEVTRPGLESLHQHQGPLEETHISKKKS